MTTYTISSHTLDGSEVWGPYTAPDDSAWIKVKLNAPVVTGQQRMFLGNVEVLIERRLTEDDEWVHYGFNEWYGDHRTGTRDSTHPAQFWVSVKDDGYSYRVTVTTSEEDTISGEVEFDTASTRPTIDTSSNPVGIVDYVIFRVNGSGGHGVSMSQRVQSPLIQARSDNAAVVLVNPEHLALFLYPCDCNTGPFLYTSTGDHKRVQWGEGGDNFELAIRGGNNCIASTPIYYLLNPTAAAVIDINYEPSDPESWLAGETPPEEREIVLCPMATYAVLVLNNVNQLSPVHATYRSGDEDSPLVSAGSGGYSYVTNMSTQPGQLLVSAGSYVSNYNEDTDGITHASGATDISTEYFLWFQSQSDEWWHAASYKVADGDSNTLIGEEWIVDPGWPYGDPYFAVSAASFAETPYVYLVVVDTPGDPGDRPDADQIRAGTDGFDSPALYATQRGPDEDGTVRFDPESVLDELSDVTFCFVYADESTPVYLEKTTGQGIYLVVVEDPGSEALYPSSAQIKAGTDYYDAPALYTEVITYPGSSGTESFSAYAGIDPATDLLFAFVTGDEDPVYLTESTEVVDTNVSASTEQLTLTTYPATLTYDVNVPASTEELTLTTYPADIAFDVSVTAGPEELTLTTYPATIGKPVNILASTEALVLTTYPATIDSARYSKGGYNKKKKKGITKKEVPDYLQRIMEPVPEPPSVRIEETKENPVVLPFPQPLPVPPKKPEPKVETLQDVIAALKETQRIQNERIELLSKLIEDKDKEIERLFEELKISVQDEMVALITAIQ